MFVQQLINSSLVDLDHSNMDVYGWGGPGVGGPGVTEHSTFPSNMPRDNLFGISPFYIETGRCDIFNCWIHIETDLRVQWLKP